jgi:hypothetical protein
MTKINFKNGSCIEEVRADSKLVRGKRALLYPIVFEYEKANPEEVNEIMEADIKELEKQKEELELKIKEYYKDEEGARVKRYEEEYAGKCFKITDGNETVYMKCLSGLSCNTYCFMHCMRFVLPINVGFKRALTINRDTKYNYVFDDNLLCFDEMTIKTSSSFSINNIKYAEEIPVEEFEAALKEYGRQLIEVSRDDYTMNGKYFKE